MLLLNLPGKVVGVDLVSQPPPNIPPSNYPMWGSLRDARCQSVLGDGETGWMQDNPPI